MSHPVDPKFVALTLQLHRSQRREKTARATASAYARKLRAKNKELRETKNILQRVQQWRWRKTTERLAA